MDSEHSSRLIIYGAVAVALIAAVGFIAFGYYDTVVKPRHRTVLEVDGIKVSFAAMKRRMRYEFFQNAAYQRSSQQAALLPGDTLNVLVDELTIVSRAHSDLGVGPPPDAYSGDPEYDKALRARVGAAPDEDQRSFADKFRRTLKASGLKESEYRRLVYADFQRNNARDKFKTELPPTVPQARLEVISAANRESAQQAIDRVKAGEPWADVAKALSTEVDVETSGGVKDFGPEDSFNPAYDDYAFTAPLGEISEPLQAPGATASGAFYVVRVLDRANKPLTPDQEPAAVTKLFNEWLERMLGQISLVNNFDAEDQTEALVDVIESVPVPQQRQQQPAVLQTSPAIDVTPAGTTPLASTPAAGRTAPAAATPVAPATTPGGG